MRAVVWTLAALVGSGSAHAAPLLDLGDRNTTGARIEAIATCDAERAITLDETGWLDTWKVATGDRMAPIGEPKHDLLQAVACAGELVLDARGPEVVLWRGGVVIARAKTSGTLAGAVVGGHAYFADEHGVYQLPADGWKPWPTEGIGLHAVVRPDLVVSGDGAKLHWHTRAGARQVDLPAEITAIADLGDAIAVGDKRGDIFVMTEPKLGKPAFTAAGEPSALGGDRSWLAVGLRDGTLVQAKRTSPMTALAPLRIERDAMYGAINAIAIAGETWLVAGDDQRVHRVARGATSYHPPAMNGHESSPWTVALDETWVVSGGSDETVRISTLDGKLVSVLHPSSETGTRPIVGVGLTPQLVWARDDYGDLYRWQRKDLKALAVIGNVSAAAPLDAGKLAVIAKEHLATLDLKTGAIHAIGSKLDFLDAKLAAGGGIAAVIEEAEEKPSVVLDARTGDVVGRIPTREGVTRGAVAVCPDGASIVYADEQTVSVWSRAKRAVVATASFATPISSLACSASGRVAVGTWDGKISIRALAGLRASSELANHHGWVLALAWSGHRLASSGADFHVVVSDVP